MIEGYISKIEQANDGYNDLIATVKIRRVPAPNIKGEPDMVVFDTEEEFERAIEEIRLHNNIVNAAYDQRRAELYALHIGKINMFQDDEVTGNV